MTRTLSALLVLAALVATACGGGGSSAVAPAGGTDLTNGGGNGGDTPPGDTPPADAPKTDLPPNGGSYRMGGFDWAGDGDRYAFVLLVSCGDAEELTATVAGSDVFGPPELFVADADGTLVSMGEMTPVSMDDLPEKYDDVECPPEWSWRASTRDGDTLPFGVTAVEELSGRDFEIRDANGVAIAADVLPVLEDGPWSPPMSPKDPGDEPWDGTYPPEWDDGTIYQPFGR